MEVLRKICHFYFWNITTLRCTPTVCTQCLQPFDNTFAINRRIIGNNFIPNAVLQLGIGDRFGDKTLLFKYPHNQKSQALQARRPPTSSKRGVRLGILVQSIHLSRTFPSSIRFPLHPP